MKKKREKKNWKREKKKIRRGGRDEGEMFLK